MLVALKDVKPNPFRNTATYPTIPGKIEKLTESINSTSFWENIVARKAHGKIEIAYGHHRLNALLEVYDESKEFNWIIRDLTDGQMIQIMARENSEDYGSTFTIIMESVRATVQALADGKIKPEEMPIEPNTKKEVILNAPYFSQQKDNYHPYTPKSIATFLGFVYKDGKSKQEVLDAINALALIESKTLKLQDKALEKAIAELPARERPKQLSTWKKQAEDIQRRRENEAEKQTRLAAERAKIDADNRQREEEAKAKREELARKEADAKREEDQAKAKHIAEQIKQREESDTKRQEVYDKSRKDLDKKIAAANERAEEERKKKIDPYEDIIRTEINNGRRYRDERIRKLTQLLPKLNTKQLMILANATYDDAEALMNLSQKIKETIKQ